MAFRVQEFRAQMFFDGARPNLFQCALTFPTLAGGPQQKYTFNARAAQLPGSYVAQVPVYYFGRELKFAGNRTFPDWTVTIINDEDFIIRDAFELWMSGINSHVGNLRDPAMLQPFAYQQDGYVTQFGKTGEIIKEYRFVGMFPTEVGDITVDWGSNDQFEEYTVTFAYQWWESLTTDSTGSMEELSPILPPIL
jgi:hypothetical protein